MESSAELYSLIYVLIAITLATVIIVESVKESSDYYERVIIQSKINSIALKNSMENNCTQTEGKVTRTLPCIKEEELNKVIIGE